MDGKVVCTEIMPANISKTLWRGIFQSILLYIMYYERRERYGIEPKVTEEKLLDKYKLVIDETRERMLTKVTENGKTIYYFEAYY